MGGTSAGFSMANYGGKREGGVWVKSGVGFLLDTDHSQKRP